MALPTISTALETGRHPKRECGYLLTHLAYVLPSFFFSRAGEAIILNEINSGKDPKDALQVYFNKVTKVYSRSPSRGKIYSADDVKAVADAIQSTMQTFAREMQIVVPPLTLFGSFPNGFAGQASDIDLMGGLREMPEHLQEKLISDIKVAIERTLQDRRLPLLKFKGIESVSLNERADYATDGRPVLIEIGAHQKKLILIPRRAVRSGGRGALVSRVDNMASEVIYIPFQE